MRLRSFEFQLYINMEIGVNDTANQLQVEIKGLRITNKFRSLYVVS